MLLQNMYLGFCLSVKYLLKMVRFLAILLAKYNFSGSNKIIRMINGESISLKI